MIACPLLLCVLGLPVFVPIARTLNRAAWPEREPVLGLWVWQCLVATALLSCLTALALSMAAVFRTVREQLFLIAAATALAPLLPLLITFAPGIDALS